MLIIIFYYFDAPNVFIIIFSGEILSTMHGIYIPELSNLYDE